MKTAVKEETANPQKIVSIKADVLIQTRLRPPDTRLEHKSEVLIIKTLLKLKSAGVKDSTLKAIDYRLRNLAKHASLEKPDAVKLFIAKMPHANSYKVQLVNAYNYLVIMNEME